MSYTPPRLSLPLLQGVPFDQAVPTAERFKAIYDHCDLHDCRRDRNNCKTILRFPDGTIFFDAKMAIDSDGSPRAREIDPTGRPETSHRYPNGDSFNAEHIPYIVLPLGGFIEATRLELGDLAVVVYRDKLAYALVADEGPAKKIGEGSIRLHELLPAPDPCTRRDANHQCLRVRDASIEKDVLYFIFPHSKIEGLTPQNVVALVNEKAAGLFDRLKGN